MASAAPIFHPKQTKESDIFPLAGGQNERCIGLPYCPRAWQITGMSGGGSTPYPADQLITDFPGATAIAYEDTPGTGLEKRLISHTEVEYFGPNQPVALDALGRLGSKKV